MEVTIISPTVQKFNGESFYKCGQYFQHKGKRLHRTVWEYHNGEIPKGYHIHHIDHNRSNNEIENLTLISASEHLSLHSNEPENKEKSRASIANARKYADLWHGSEEGKEFHRKLAKDYWKTVKPHKEKCAWCGCEFETRDVSHRKDRFCCNNHKAAALRWRRKHEGKTNYPFRQS